MEEQKQEQFNLECAEAVKKAYLEAFGKLKEHADCKSANDYIQVSLQISVLKLLQDELFDGDGETLKEALKDEYTPEEISETFKTAVKNIMNFAVDNLM